MLGVVRPAVLVLVLVLFAPVLGWVAAAPAGAGQVDEPAPMTVSVSPARFTLRWGQRAAMTVTITNTGMTGLFALRVLDCDDSVRFPLPPGSSVSVPCELGPFSPAGRVFDVIATAYAGGRFVSASAPFEVTVLPPVGSVDVEYLIDGAAPDDAEQIVDRPLGGSLQLAARVTNTGPVPLRDLVVDRFGQGRLTCPSSVLEPGASMVCGPWIVPIDRVDVVLDMVAVTGFGPDDAPASWAAATRWRGVDPTPACPASPTLLHGLEVGLEVGLDDGPVAATLADLRAREGDTMVVRWAGWQPGSEGCRISLVQYGGAAAVFDPAVEQRLVAAASCTGEACRAAGGTGYELRLVVQRMDGPAQFDLVTGTPLSNVGPTGGYYSGWLNGGTHRLIDAGTSVPG